jgi:hypothetical protein
LAPACDVLHPWFSACAEWLPHQPAPRMNAAEACARRDGYARGRSAVGLRTGSADVRPSRHTAAAASGEEHPIGEEEIATIVPRSVAGMRDGNDRWLRFIANFFWRWSVELPGNRCSHDRSTAGA